MHGEWKKRNEGHNAPIEVAPASSEFSSSSLTAVAMSRTTWPEQMRWTDSLSMALIELEDMKGGGGGNEEREVALTRSSSCWLHKREKKKEKKATSSLDLDWTHATRQYPTALSFLSLLVPSVHHSCLPLPSSPFHPSIASLAKHPASHPTVILPLGPHFPLSPASITSFLRLDS